LAILITKPPPFALGVYSWVTGALSTMIPYCRAIP
jgi:hypothetical protein